MNWIGMLIGAAAGALSALLLAFVLQLSGRREPSQWHRWAYVLIFGLTWGLSKEFITPKVERWYFVQTMEDRLADSNPAFMALRKFEPETFAAIIARAKVAVRDSDDPLAMQEAVRTEFQPLVGKRLPLAEDHVVHGYMKTNIQELRELHVGGDEACYTYLFPGTGPAFNPISRIKAETMQADLTAVAMLIESAATRPQKRLSITDVQPQAQPTFTAMQAKHGEALGMLDKPQTTLEAKRKVCELMMDLYGRLLDMPPSDGGRVIRAMLSE